MTTGSLPLQSLPPIPPRRTLKAPLPAYNSTAGARRRISPIPLYIACAKRSPSPSPDGYHATLRALNSKGRTPRKSLGQVSLLSLLFGSGENVNINDGSYSLSNCFCNYGVRESSCLLFTSCSIKCTNERLWLQHYMLNNEINEQLANVASVEEGDVVLEIGPGTGSLTNVLINAGAIVLAIEKVSCLEHKAYLLAPVLNFMLACTSFLDLYMMQFGII